MKTTNFSSMFIAFILALGVAGVVYFVQKQPGSSEKQQNEDVTEILVSKLTLKPGERVNLNKFKWVEWPKASLQNGYFSREEKEEIKKVNGMVAHYEILAGEPLKKGDLVGADGKSILTAFIKPNMRAVTVPLKKVANPSVHVAPGDFIDIILPQRKGRAKSVDTVLNGIKVIAVDDDFFTPDGETPTTIAKNITLEVDQEQAEALALSISQGHIVISYHSAYTPQSGPKKGVKKISKPKKITINRGLFD